MNIQIISYQEIIDKVNSMTDEEIILKRDGTEWLKEHHEKMVVDEA